MDKPDADISDDDVRAALKDLKTYVDVTEDDLRKIYGLALEHATQRLDAGGPACDACPRLTSGTSEKSTASKQKRPIKAPPRVGFLELFWSSLGALAGIALCAWLSSRFFEPRDLTLMIGSIGASAVLVFGAIKSPFAQPRNLIGGHLVSAFAGVAAWQVLGGTAWLAAALAVSLAVAAMLATNTVHPPGGATALIAVIGGEQVHKLGFLYPFIPVAAAALLLLAVALAVNNIPAGRSYPEYWF